MDKKQAVRIAEKYAERVAKEFHPMQILLFGSYLEGTYNESSDIDIAIIFDKDSEPKNWLTAASRMQTIRWETKESEVIEPIEPHIMRVSNNPASLARHVQEVGKVLYQRT